MRASAGIETGLVAARGARWHSGFAAAGFPPRRRDPQGVSEALACPGLDPSDGPVGWTGRYGGSDGTPNDVRDGIADGPRRRSHGSHRPGSRSAVAEAEAAGAGAPGAV